MYGRTRAAPDVPAGLPVVYTTSIGFSDSFCGNGVFLYRSFDHGQTWARPVVPPLVPLRGRSTEVVFYDRRGDPGNKLADAFRVLGRPRAALVRPLSPPFASNFDDAFCGDGSFILRHLLRRRPVMAP